MRDLRNSNIAGCLCKTSTVEWRLADTTLSFIRQCSLANAQSFQTPHIQFVRLHLMQSQAQVDIILVVPWLPCKKSKVRGIKKTTYIVTRVDAKSVEYY